MAQEATQGVPAERLEQLNQYTRRTHTAEEVFLFDVRLCDNEIDRDNERFSPAALAQLQELFVGRTGIFDHNPRGQNQTARIFATELETDTTRTTVAGEPYTCLKGHAYMVRTEKNQDLIAEIDAGIKKEVSISCTAQGQSCSVCGSDRRRTPCIHQPGQPYGGAVCHTVLSDITDAYEWSFVAIPAQREAGVTKQYGGGEGGRCKMLEAQLQAKDAMLCRVEDLVRQDIIRLRFLVEGTAEQDAVSHAIRRMPLEDLLAFRETLRTKQTRQCRAQLTAPSHSGSANTAFHLEQKGR